MTQQELFDALTEHMQMSTLPFDERPTVREHEVAVDDDDWGWPAAFDGSPALASFERHPEKEEEHAGGDAGEVGDVRHRTRARSCA
jgi:hypothetical protein